MYGKHLNMFKLQKHITRLKKRKRYKYFKELGSQAIQEITQRIDKAYKLFFNNLKRGVKTSPPKFRKFINYNSFILKQAGYMLLQGNKIRIGKKIYKYHKSRDIEGKIKTLTVKRDTLGDFYIYFVCETEIADIEVASRKIAGFDFGLKTFLTNSEEEKIECPQYYKKSLNQLSKTHKRLSSKKKGSNKRKKVILHLNRLYKKINNRRGDFFFKLAHELTDNYDVLIFEDLNLKAIQKRWGRKLSDLSPHRFLSIIGYLCQVKGKTFHKIPRYEPTSKTCHKCGHINNNLSLKERSWTCPKCKSILDRDVNAAINIKRVGVSTLGLGSLRSSLKATTV